MVKILISILLFFSLNKLSIATPRIDPQYYIDYTYYENENDPELGGFIDIIILINSRTKIKNVTFSKRKILNRLILQLSNKLRTEDELIDKINKAVQQYLANSEDISQKFSKLRDFFDLKNFLGIR